MIGIGPIRIRLVGIVRRVGVLVLVTLVLVTTAASTTTPATTTSTIPATVVAGAPVVGAFAVVGAVVVAGVRGVLGTLVGRIRRGTLRRRPTTLGATLRTIRRRVVTALTVAAAGCVRRGGGLRGKEERAGGDLLGRRRDLRLLGLDRREERESVRSMRLCARLDVGRLGRSVGGCGHLGHRDVCCVAVRCGVDGRLVYGRSVTCGVGTLRVGTLRAGTFRVDGLRRARRFALVRRIGGPCWFCRRGCLL